MSGLERFPYPRPPVRPLKIYAFDPMVGLDRRTRVSVDTRNEPLRRGPLGARIVVVDYDASQDCYYEPVDLDESAILMQGGIDHSEGDPRFHQQMVYAVASRIVEIFDRALGRPVDLGSSNGDGKPKPIRLLPHAFADANAFYDPSIGAILFGYFRASVNDPGANIPGQIIFTCLSHDVIAHELTHALIHHLSPALLNSEHPDTLALHEGLSDLVAILHRFSLETVVRDEMQRTRGVLDLTSPLCQVANQFGAGLGMRHGLRDTRSPADPKQYATLLEPHQRGALLISATLEALFRAYRNEDVIRDMDPEKSESYLLFLMTKSAPPGQRLRPFRSDWEIPIAKYQREYPHLVFNERLKRALAQVGSGTEFDLVTKLEKSVNGTSLLLMFVVGRAHLLFPGDAQWGTWKAALAEPEWQELLSKTAFYKIGHHGSHNATPRSFVEKHLSKKFSAMVSTRGVKKWPEIPRGPLLTALRKRSNQVVRSDLRDLPDPASVIRKPDYVETKIPI